MKYLGFRNVSQYVIMFSTFENIENIQYFNIENIQNIQNISMMQHTVTKKYYSLLEKNGMIRYISSMWDSIKKCRPLTSPWQWLRVKFMVRGGIATPFWLLPTRYPYAVFASPWKHPNGWKSSSIIVSRFYKVIHGTARYCGKRFEYPSAAACHCIREHLHLES